MYNTHEIDWKDKWIKDGRMMKQLLSIIYTNIHTHMCLYVCNFITKDCSCVHVRVQSYKRWVVVNAWIIFKLYHPTLIHWCRRRSDRFCRLPTLCWFLRATRVSADRPPSLSLAISPGTHHIYLDQGTARRWRPLREANNCSSTEDT